MAVAAPYWMTVAQAESKVRAGILEDMAISGDATACLKDYVKRGYPTYSKILVEFEPVTDDGQSQ